MTTGAPLLTAQEVAAILKLHISTVYSLTRRGHLKAVVLGKGSRRRAQRITQESLTEFINRGGVESVPLDGNGAK